MAKWLHPGARRGGLRHLAQNALFPAHGVWDRRPRPLPLVLTDAFCRAHLDEAYAQLARQATAALCRKRPSPLATGTHKAWACGIVYALGSANFLFDKSQTPTMRAADLCAGFGVSQSTGSAKAKVVRDALGMKQINPQWY